MKQVFEQYASAIISVFVATTVIVVVVSGSFGNHKGLGRVLGQILTSSIEEYSINENQAYDTYMSSVAPCIELKNFYLIEDKRILLTDCFQAKSHNGNLLPVYLKKAWSLDGEEKDFGASVDGTSICVPEAGVYWVQVCAIDSNRKETCVQLKLLVNER